MAVLFTQNQGQNADHDQNRTGDPVQSLSLHPVGESGGNNGCNGAGYGNHNSRQKLHGCAHGHMADRAGEDTARKTCDYINHINLKYNTCWKSTDITASVVVSRGIVAFLSRIQYSKYVIF